MANDMPADKHPAPFVRTGDNAFHAQSTAAGPWSPGHCHGGAPAALMVHVADAVPVTVPMEIARVTVNLMRPVPVAKLTVATRIIRQGRNIQILEVSLEADGAGLVSRAEILRVRRGDTRAAATPLPTRLPKADAGAVTHPPIEVGFSRLFEMRAVRGSFEAPGPSAIWLKMRSELVAGEQSGAAARALACADFANGTGAGLSFTDWSYPNADLTVAFAREPQGNWLLLDADCWVGPAGRGMAHARLADREGWFGCSVQTAVIDRRVDV